MVWAGFAVGMLGSFHCLGMCGPIALALPRPGAGRWPLLRGRLLYNLGRLLTYATLGALFGLLGRTITLAGTQQYLSIGAGALMLLFVLVPNVGFRPAARLTGQIKQRLGGLLRRRSAGAQLLIGVLNGLLPCGLVYVALAGALAMGSVWQGAAYMALFGVGTAPIMLAVSLAGRYLSVSLRSRIRRFVPVLVGLMGLLFVVRGLNLGIPYLSPKVHKFAPIERTFECCEPTETSASAE